MDVFSLDLTIFLIATFAGALVAGLSGFAFGLVAAIGMIAFPPYCAISRRGVFMTQLVGYDDS